jgi:hypothetical protein
MSILEKLNVKLQKVGLENFYRQTKHTLSKSGLIVIEPHKIDGNKFYSVVGIMGNGLVSNGDLDILNNDAFIKFAEMEMIVLEGRGVSHTFYIDANAMLSYITYPFLKKDDLFFANATLPTEEDELLKIVDNIRNIRNSLKLWKRINTKRIKKTYISKAKMWGKKSDSEIGKMYNKKMEGQDVYRGFRIALKMFCSYMENLE